METIQYFFIYAVDTVTASAEMRSYVMIMDHGELTETIRDAHGRGEVVTGITLSMYDEEGNFLKDRDVTSYVISRLSVSNHKDVTTC